MKKVMLLVCTVAVILPISLNIYSQPVQNPSVSPLSVTEFNTYGSTRLSPEQETLKYINADNDSYTYTPVNKMGNGIINTTTSWMDVSDKIVERTDKSNLLAGVTLGFGEGMISGLVRGASGIVDMATFGLPPYDKPLMETSHKVENPNEGFRIDVLKW